MKHQVFFFLLINFCFMQAMDKYERKASKLIERCALVNRYCPNTYDIKGLEEGKKELLQLSSMEQKKILKEAYRYAPRRIREINGQIVLDWKYSNGKKYSADNRIYST